MIQRLGWRRLGLRSHPPALQLAELVWADGTYNARQVELAAAKQPPLRVEMVKRPNDCSGFFVLPRRWVVERTFSWFGRNRRLAKDYENRAETRAAFITPAGVQLVASINGFERASVLSKDR